MGTWWNVTQGYDKFFAGDILSLRVTFHHVAQADSVYKLYSIYLKVKTDLQICNVAILLSRSNNIMVLVAIMLEGIWNKLVEYTYILGLWNKFCTFNFAINN